MLIEGTIPPKPVELNTDTSDLLEAARSFVEAHPDARIEAVDGKIVRGICCKCGRPIMEDEQRYAFNVDESTYECPQCNKE